AVAAIERAGRNGVGQVERLADGARGQHLYLQLALSHVVDLACVVLRELVENVVGRPGALEAQRHRRALRAGNGRKTQGRGARYGRRAREETKAGRGGVVQGLL